MEGNFATANLSTPPPSMNIPPPNMSNSQMPNLSVPPPGMPGPGPNPGSNSFSQRFDNRNNFNNRNFFKPFQPFGPRGGPIPLGPMTLEDFDGKRLRKSVMRKTVDYNSSIIKALENRVWQRDFRDRRALQPDVMYYPDLMPPPSYTDNAMNCVTTRFVKTATNKMRCPIFCMAWTPEGRRLVTGASSGEFTLWNGLTFNFETILQAHDSPVRTMVWSHNDSWMVTGDHAGYVKYWQSNMNNVKMFQAHKEALRGISFSPTDSKFVTCSDDGTLRIWDFLRCHEERVLRGHGADVKCVHWHPQKGLIISGSKDNQQPIKLWDPKTGQSLATLHAHKSTVMDLKWNENGNWLITASRDHLLKLFDVRNLNQEVQTFRGHKKEASSVAWHPVHEGLFSSGGSDGSIMFWHVGADKEVGAIEQAHDSIVWTLAWHPLGHILCSGSNDHTSKFWTRNRPGDLMRDKYNLNTLPVGLAGLEDADIDEPSVIPGMGPEDKIELTNNEVAAIPGLDLDIISVGEDKQAKMKKVPYSKPIPRNFQAQWNETGDEEADTINEVISQIVENTPGVVPLQKIEPSAIIVYGKLLPVEPGSKIQQVISEGPEALKKYIASGAIEELHDVMPHDDDNDYLNDAYNDDDEPSSVAANLDVALPTPLQSAKLAQSLANQSQNSSSQQSNNGDGNKSEKPRKSRFSDINDMESNMDMDMRMMHSSMGNDDPYGNGRMGDMMNNYRDMDYRSNMNLGSRMDTMDMRQMSLEEEMMYGKGGQNYDMHNSRMSSMDIDFRNRYDNYGDDSPKYSNSPYGDRDSPWNDPYSKGSNSNDGYSFGRNSNSGYSGNQNGSYGGGSGLQLGGFSSNNYRGSPSSNLSQNVPFSSNQFRPEPLGRPEGNWSNMPPQRQDNFNRNNNRNNNFNQRRGGGGPSRNQRGPRGGMWMPPRGNNQSRGRNVF